MSGRTPAGPRRLFGAATALSIVLGLGGTTTSASAAFECHGRAPTKVGTPQNDDLLGTPGVDVIVGLGGDDVLVGLQGDDVLCGNDGLDVLNGGAGDDILDGGQGGGDGVLYFSAPAGVRVDLAAGSATGHGTDSLFEIENVFGSDFDDVLLGSADDNVIYPLGGDDLVDGREGAFDMIGYDLSPGPVQVALEGGTASGAEGSDTIAGIELISGSQHDDVLTGDDEVNGLFGQGGHDQLWGRRGNDFLEGNAGNDYLSGGAGEDDFAAYAGAPGPVSVNLAAGTATGGDANDTLVAVEDVLGSHHDDRLVGDGAENIFIPGAGGDLVDGGAGLDLVSFFSTTEGEGVVAPNPGPVVVDLAAQTGFDASTGDQDTLIDLESAAGSLGDDVIRGHAGLDILFGEAGDDLLAGRAGQDSLNGGSGDDRLRGGKSGHDTASYTTGDAVTVDLTTGTATSGDGTDDLQGIEAAIGSDEADALRGDGGRNWLLGRAGPDAVAGRGGSDILDGEKGKDRLDGGAGFDYCLDKPNVRCEESDLPPAVEKVLKQIKKLEEIAAKKRRGLKSFKSP